MSYFSNLIRGRWRDETIITDETGTNVAIVDASGALKVTTAGGTGGVLTPGAPATVTIGAASVTIVPANPARRGLVMRNLSLNAVSLSFDGNPAVLYSGDTLYPLDAFYMATDIDLTLGDVNAIASGAGTDLAIQEYQ